MSSFHLSVGWAIADAITICFAIAYPIVLAIIANLRLRVSWRYFLFGAIIFFVFQIILRIPWVEVIGTVYGKQIKASPMLLWGWLTVLVVTAALFEEVGRYIGYRVFMRKEEKTWNKAVMYGLGHGGIESILIVGLSGALTLLNLAILSTVNLNVLPVAQRASVTQQLAAIAAQPGWLPLLGAWERLWTVPVHVALSVLVLQVFRRGNIGWLWLAILGHIIVDGVTVAVSQGLVPTLGAIRVDLLVEGAVAIFGIIAIWIIWRLRERPDGQSRAGAVPGGVESPVAMPHTGA